MQRWMKWMTTGVGAAMLCVSSQARADVQIEGQWPEASSKVSLHVENANKDLALGELAKKAGWNLVLHGDFRESGPVSLDVTDADAKDVAEAILGSGKFVAKVKGESGKLIEITALHEGASPPAKSSEADVKSNKRDRAVLGQNLRVEKDEVVGDVSVTGGSAEIFGKVDGDLVVTGGSVTVHDGAQVSGDTLAIGGRVHVEKGGKVLGDNKVIGGVFTRDDETTQEAPDERRTSLWVRGKEGASDLFGAFTFLFVVGALFLAVAPNRMLRLRTELAAQPVASVAYGIGGLIGVVLAAIVLCITVIGIPFAAILTLLAIVAVTGSLAAALTTAGAALVGHRSQNHYVQLAVGAALFALCGIVPWIGGLLQFGAVLAACGVLVTTRVAGYVTRKDQAPPSSGQPYR